MWLTDSASQARLLWLLHGVAGVAVVTYQHGMQIDAIHVMPFDFVQVAELGAGGRHALELLMQLRDACLELAALIGQQAKLGDVALGVPALIIVSQFGCKVKQV